ncbi:MAG: DUF2808 domain-containing protein [Spirulinaceae cyanobacterium]
MFLLNTLKKHFPKVLGVAGCLLAASPFLAYADGLTIFSGVNSELNVEYDFNNRNSRNARYRLQIPSKRVENAVSQISIYIPDYYGEMDDRLRDLECVENCEYIEGERNNRILQFEDADDRDDVIEVGYGRKYRTDAELGNVTIEENCFENWDGDDLTSFHCMRIPLQEAIAPRTPIQVKLSHIRNPDFEGTFYFHALLVTCLDEEGCFGNPEHRPINDSPNFEEFRRGSLDFIGTWIVTVGL